MILQNTEPKLKVGPIQNRDGKAFGRRRLFENEVLFSLNSSPLSPNPGAKGYNADINGYYDIEVPGEYTRDPGVFSIVIQVDGHPTFKFDYKVEEEQEFAKPEDLENIHEKLTTIYTTSPRSIDFSEMLTAVRNGFHGLQSLYERLDAVEESIKALDKEPTKCLAGGLDEKIGAVGKQVACHMDWAVTLNEEIRAVAKEVSEIKGVSAYEIMSEAVECLADKNSMTTLHEDLEEIKKTIENMKLIKQKDITGHDGPLDTKNGRVRVAEGRDEGEIDLVNGQTLARDVADKTGWVLGASGFDVITAKIEQIVKKMIPGKKPNIKKR